MADSGSVVNLSVMCTDLASVTIPSERVMTGLVSRGALERTDTRFRTGGLGLSVVLSATI